jgi:hypothetical protein
MSARAIESFRLDFDFAWPAQRIDRDYLARRIDCKRHLLFSRRFRRAISGMKPAALRSEYSYR